LATKLKKIIVSNYLKDTQDNFVSRTLLATALLLRRWNHLGC